MKARSVVFAHGMFVTPLCWEHWLTRYQALGHRVHAPPWPGRDEPVPALRAKHPDPELGQLSLQDVTNWYAQYIATLKSEPVLIGHSMGGLVVQLLLERGLGIAGIAIDSAPPLGVFALSWPFLKSNWPTINPFISKHTPYWMPFEQFQYTFVHTLPVDEQRAAYDRYVVPESRWVARGPISPAARIDFSARRPPLLLIAGVEDHIIPAALNARNCIQYERRAGVTDYREFPERTHFIIGQPGWEEVADYALSWLDDQGL
ncbi:MAG TPA: alpha/beta hydrolase [Burkholderiaceae bacterium]|jgi:pimeloyl-ACP methyl ester carboxylesterase|nr:alpha/beta hydrolase [Burkholderiaceae bacterium]